MIYFPTYAIRCYWSIPCVFGNPERTNSVKIASKHIKFVAMKNLLLSIFALSILLFTSEAFAQGVGIGATDFAPGSDALLELRSTNKGFLTPRMTEAQKNAIASPTAGLMIYQTNNTTGFYYYSGSVWLPFVAADNLGNHLATQDIVMDGNKIVNVAGGAGIKITDAGNVGIGIGAGVPAAKLDVIAGDIQVTSSGSGSAYGIKLQNPAGTFTTTLKAGAQTANLVYTLPVAAPTAGQVLSSNGTGTLSWVNNGSGWGLTGNGGITASTAAIGSAVNNNFLGTTDAKDLVFATNSRERFRVTSAGNLGIGTLAPGRLLHVVGGDNSSSVDVATTNILAQVENTTNNGSVVFNIQAKNPTNTFSSRLGINPTYDVGGVGPGVYTWYAGMNGTNKQLMMYDFINANLHFAPSSAVINNIAIGLCQPTIGSKLTVNGNLAISNGTGSYTTTAAPAGGAIIEGNVGIGTNSPGQRLQVADGNILLSRTGGSAGEIRFQGTSSGVTAFKAGAQGATNITYTLPVTAPSAGQVLSSNGTGTLSWVSNGGGWGLTGTSGTTASTASIGSAVNNNFMGTTDSKDLVMATNNRERLRISSNGNVGLGTTTPSTTLDVNGSVAYKRNNVTCANGVNSNLNVGNYSFIKISGPTAAFSITGITGGVDGRIVTLYNSTGQNMTITNDATSTAANRVLTLTGASIATSGTGTVTLQYDSASSRWIVIALQL
jgi:hypothetical protein